MGAREKDKSKNLPQRNKEKKTYICFDDKYKLATEVAGYPKGPFSLAAALRCRGGECYYFPLIAPLTLDPYRIMMNVKQRGIKYYFTESLV